MKDIQLILTNPCSESWDDMKEAGAGRYCDRCEKNIVDLTRKTDSELILFFRNKNKNVCGRLLSSQLHRNLMMPPSKLSWPWLLPFALTAIVSPKVKAQDVKPEIVQDDHASSPLPAEAPSDVKPASKDTISKQAVSDRNLKSSKPTVMVGAVSSISRDQKPLCLVYAGEESCTLDVSRLSEISPEWIEKIEVLKDAKATAIYGAKGAYGVILIEIKKAHASKINFSAEKQ